MTPTTSEACRTEALRQGRLANEAFARNEFKVAREHIERARDMALHGLKLEADEAKEANQRRLP